MGLAHGFSSQFLNLFEFSISVKSVHFGHVHSQLFAQVNTRVQEKVLSLSYHAIVIFEQLILFQRLIFPLMYFTKLLGLLIR